MREGEREGGRVRVRLQMFHADNKTVSPVFSFKDLTIFLIFIA